MNSKKAITLLVLATLMMALVPAVSVKAISITQLKLDGAVIVEGDDVQKGQEITVEGGGVAAGATVNFYWDNAEKETFTAGSGKVASGTAKKDGTYSIKFKVPEGVAGLHYIWIKTGTQDPITTNVKVIPKLTASSDSGLKGDRITLTGYGYGYDDVDEKGLEVTITFGNSVKTGDSLAVAPTTKPKTNSLGTWTYTFTITAEDYADDYPIDAIDIPDGNADAVYYFTVGASITLSLSEGPVGSVVTITGRGFNKGTEISVSIDGLELKDCTVISGETVRSDGRISAKIVIPSVELDPDEESTEYTITVEDEEIVIVDPPSTIPMNTATATFDVNGAAEIKAVPSYGMQGTSITVEGWNFTRISGTEVKVAFTTATTGSKTFKTDSKGYFKGTITIPAIDSTTQTLEATIENHDIEASAQVRVGIMLVILTPATVPSGALVSVTGVGFEESAFTVNIGDDEWFTGTTDGTISESKNVPTLEPGTYTVTVIEEETEIEVTAVLTVTEKTKVALSPVMAPNEYPVTIEGWYFAESPEDKSLEFILYNTTINGVVASEWLLSVEYNSLAVELEADEDWDDGYFKGTFEVPEEDSIGLGTYTLNVTDGMGMFAQIAFQVVSKTTEITSRKQTFRISETVAFNVESSFKQEDAYIKIYDPSGNQYWRTDAFETGKWTKIGDVQIYPFYQQTAGGNQMILMEDAPLGTYTWKWYDKDAELLDSGSFSVAAATESLLSAQITDLNEAVNDIQTGLTTVSTEMAAVKTQITNSINAANAAVQAANAATQAVNAVAQTASAASTAATAAAAAATEAKNAANGLTTLVYGAIGASLVAALAAIVSLMQISRRIAG